MKKRIGIAFMALWMVYAGETIAQDDAGKLYTLKECIETGLKNNLAVQQSDLQLQADEIGWKQAKLNLLPSVNGNVSHGINQGRSIDPFSNSYINEKVDYANYSLSSSLVLFNGLSLQNAIKRNNLTYKASEMDLQQQKDDLTIRIILAYLQVLSNTDLLEQAKNRVELTRNQVTRQEQLNAAGAIAPPVLSDLRGQQASDELSVITTQQSLETAKLNLCQLMNIPYSKNMQFEKMEAESFVSIYPDSAGAVYNSALEHFALVKSVDYKKQSAEKGVKMRQGALWPTLSFGADAYTNYSSVAMKNTFLNTSFVPSNDYVDISGTHQPVIKEQSNFSSEKITYGSQINNNLATSLSLNLRIPIFNALQNRNQVKLARLDLKNAQLVEQSTYLDLRRSIDQAFINMQTAFDRYKTIQVQVSAYSESYDAAEIRFSNGVGTSIDYLTAKNNLEAAKINLINAKYDYVLRTKVLDYYQGKQTF